MTFYVVILGMCKFTVVNDRKGHGAIDFVYPGTYKVILRRQKFGQVRSKFYYIKQDFIVLRGSSNFFKVLCREFVIVHWEGGTVGSPRGVGEWGDYDPNTLTGIIK